MSITIALDPYGPVDGIVEQVHHASPLEQWRNTPHTDDVTRIRLCRTRVALFQSGIENSSIRA